VLEGGGGGVSQIVRAGGGEAEVADVKGAVQSVPPDRTDLERGEHRGGDGHGDHQHQHGGGEEAPGSAGVEVRQ
jgi:hypothetical protein